MNRIRNKKRRITLLALMLLATGILLSAATYAWFTANQIVAVNNLRVNVAAQHGIQISADGTNWRAILNTQDLINAAITYPASINQLPEIFEPVSTIGTMNAAGRMEMWYGDVQTNDAGDHILTTTQSIETRGHGESSTGHFIAFDMFLRVDIDLPVFLTPQSGVIHNADFGPAGNALDRGIKNSARVAFVNLGNVPVGTSLAAIQALNAGEAATVRIWEPNYDVHTPAGAANALDRYGIVTGLGPGAARLSYRGVSAAISATDNIRITDTYNPVHTAFFAPVTPLITTRFNFTTNVAAFNLQEGITKKRVYFWIEGQDVDCENTASDGSITLNLQLSTLPT